MCPLGGARPRSGRPLGPPSRRGLRSPRRSGIRGYRRDGAEADEQRERPQSGAGGALNSRRGWSRRHAAARQHELDLDRLDPPAVVAEEAAAAVELLEQTAHAPVLGIDAEQREGARGLRLRAHPEREHGAEQVLERLPSPTIVSLTSCVEMIGTASSERPIRCSDASSVRPTGSLSSRQPSSKENTFSRSRSELIRCIANIAISRTSCSPRRSDCEYSERGVPGSGAGQVPDRKVGDLLVPRGTDPTGSAKAELGEPARAYTSSVSRHPPLAGVAGAERAHDLQAPRLSGAGDDGVHGPAATALSQAPAPLRSGTVTEERAAAS